MLVPVGNLCLLRQCCFSFRTLAWRCSSSEAVKNRRPVKLCEWRRSKGLPENPNRERVLMDLPDYSFTDGRPVPYGSKQRVRILKQRAYTAKIIELTKEIDFAVKRFEDNQKSKEDEVKRVLSEKLDSKGKKFVDSE